MPKRQANVFADMQISPPGIGNISLGEIESRLYCQSNREDSRKWDSSELPVYDLLHPELDESFENQQPNKNLFKSSSSLLTKVMNQIDYSPPLSPVPPTSDKPVIASNQSYFERTAEYIRWSLYNFGLSSQRPYEFHPLPSSLSLRLNSRIIAFACHPHLEKIAIALSDNSVHIYELNNHKWDEIMIITHQFQQSILCLEWKPLSGTILAVGCSGGVLIWEGDWMTRYLNCPSVSNVSSLQWSPTEPLLAVGCPHTSVVIWNVSTCVPTRLNSVPPSSSYLIRWSPNGHYLFQASLDGSFTIWETMTWTKECWTLPDRLLIQTACWSADSHYLVYAISGKSEFFCLVFDHVVPRIEGVFYQRIPLGSFRVNNIDEDGNSNNKKGEKVCGQISELKWDVTGERLMVSFCSHQGNNSVIAIFSTPLFPQVKFEPMGFLRVPQNCSNGIRINFCNRKQNGCYALAASSECLSTMPIIFTPEPRSANNLKRRTLFIQ